MAFHEIRFPDNISRGARGGPERRTQVVELASGDEERNASWANSRRRYDVAYGIRRADDLAAVVAFFEARNGRLLGFRYKDWADYKSSLPSQAITPTDQQIGTGTGSLHTFQLAKRYTSGPQTWLRTIAKPVAGTVRVALGMVEQMSGWTLDATTGVVTFTTAPGSGVMVRAGQRDADLAADVVGAVRFGTCPACYAEVIDHDHEVEACHLCKTPLDSQRARDRVVGVINELSIQIKQSERLQEIRSERLKTYHAQLSALEGSWRIRAQELADLISVPTSQAREEIRRLQRSMGYIDKSIEDIEGQVKLANRIGDLSARKSQLDQDIQSLGARISALQLSQTDRLRSAKASIEKNIIEILRGDLRRQDSFENPEHIQFSFAKNTITVDGHTYFSASSRVVLKSAFMVGFLKAALYDPKFRHPRFLMIDITEDKGIELARSHNFQKQVIGISVKAPVEHQIIIATAAPWPDIKPEMFVGKHSTLQDGTLSFLPRKVDDEALGEINGKATTR